MKTPDPEALSREERAFIDPSTRYLKASPTTPLPIGVIAKVLEWSVSKTRTWLDAIEKERPGIIVRVRGRRMMTISALRTIFPDFGKKVASDKDLSEVRDLIATARREIMEVAKAQGILRRETLARFSGVGDRLTDLERAVGITAFQKEVGE